MSLIKCDECGRMISDKSQFCPQCGYPTSRQSALQQPQESAATTDERDDTEQLHADNRRKVWAYIAVVLAVTAIIGVCYFAGSPAADGEAVDQAAEPEATEAVAAEADTVPADTIAPGVAPAVNEAAAPAPKPAAAPAAPKPAATPKAETAPEAPLPVDDKPLEPTPAPPAPAPAPTLE